MIFKNTVAINKIVDGMWLKNKRNYAVLNKDIIFLLDIALTKIKFWEFLYEKENYILCFVINGILLVYVFCYELFS